MRAYTVTEISKVLGVSKQTTISIKIKQNY